MDRIVVGIDGSPSSREALEYAVAEAKCHGGKVTAVHVYELASPMMLAEGVTLPTVLTDDVREEAERRAERILEETVAVPDRDMVVTQAIEGPVARTLLQVAEGADLIVIGSRGLGGFRGLLLGSVAHKLVHHATCPVVVIPHG